MQKIHYIAKNWLESLNNWRQSRLYYVFQERIIYQGDKLYSRRLKKVMSAKQMKRRQMQLVKQYKVPEWTVAFDFDEIGAVGNIIGIALNEIRKECIMYLKQKVK